MAEFSFNASEVEPSRGFDLLPSGDYIAVINASEMKATKTGTGRFLALEFEIIEGEYTGRKLFVNLNLENPNPDAVKIARADLSAICHAVNVLVLKDSVELHNLQMVITVGQRKNKGTGDMQNVINKYSAKQGFAPNAQPAYKQPGPPAKAPWSR